MKSHSFKILKHALVACFIISITVVACSKKSSTPPVPLDKTALQKAIDTAQMLNDNTVEGTKPGEYEANSKAPLTNALTASKAVYNSTSATQADINNTVAQLNAAIAAYRGHYIQEIAAANLIGYWKMNGNANDSSGNGNNGTLKVGAALYGAGTPVPTADRFGRANMAYHFDKGGNIEVPYKATLNPKEMTISLWVKWSSAGRTWDPHTYTMVALNRWNGFKFQLQDIHLPQYTVKVVEPAGDTTIYDRATNITTPVAEETWTNLVVTFKAGTENYYMNGDLVATWDATSSRPVPGTPITLTNPINFTIGQDLPTDKYQTVDGDFQVAWGGFWTGDLDDVMFYNIALTGPQVMSIYNNQKSL